jgi:hypothetical protein
MFLEYDWTFAVYRPRLGHAFTAVNGLRSYESLDVARYELGLVGLALGKKTDSRTWCIEAKESSK